MPNNQFMSASAPQMMLAPDIATQQNQLARQQQLADMLRERSLTQDSPTEMVSGWAIKKSPWEGVSKLAQALGSGYMQKSVDDKQMALAKAMQERMGAAFDNMSGGARPGTVPSGAIPAMPTPQNQPIDPMQVTEGAPAGTLPAQAPTQPMAAPPQLSQVDQIRNQAKAAYMMGNTELANKLLENISTLTTEQRNMAAMGQNPLEMGRFGTAAARKAGIIELQPGTTALDLNTGIERFQPKVGEGITLNNGVASALPGYAGANAEIAGASAGAVSGAQAGNKMVTVNVGGRPVMMTEAQAVQMSGGGAPQAGMQFNNPNPGGLSLDFKGGPRATFDMISQIKDPTIRAQAMQALSQMPSGPVGGAAPGAPRAGVGIAGSTPAEDAQRMADVKLSTEPQLVQKTQEYKAMADYGKELDAKVSESQAVLQRVAQSREALSQFKAGGGAENRAKLASMAQAFGVPDTVVNKIAGGDLAAAQVFQKFAAQEALGIMQQALASDSGKGSQGNRISMELFIKNNPNITTDPNAIEKVFNFLTTQAQQSKAQQEAYHEFKSNPHNDPSAFPSYWAGEAIKRGYVKPEIVNGAAKGTTPASAPASQFKYLGKE